MTEIDYLKLELEVKEKAFDRLNKLHMELLKKQGELEERNQRQYNQLKELGDLMLKRDWETLENIADDWEKQEKQLQHEYGDIQ